MTVLGNSTVNDLYYNCTNYSTATSTTATISNVGSASTNWGLCADSTHSIYDYYSDTIKDMIKSYDLYYDIETRELKLIDPSENKNNNNNNKEEKQNMENFGSYTGNSLRLSPYGIAVKNKTGKWVSYNPESKRLFDVDILNVEIDVSKMFFKVPKAISAVSIGDIILHNGNPVFVEEIKDNKFMVINPYEGTEVTILPAVSPFGFDYIIAIVSLTDYMPAADVNNPFGNLLPFLIGKDNQNLGLILALSGGIDKVDPMMLALMSGGDNIGLILAMSQLNKKNINEAS